MLSKKQKLPIQDFVGRSGRTVRGPYFFLKIFPVPAEPDSATAESGSATTNYSRFGIVISKKVANKAVERNRIKRIIFDFFQKKLDQLPVNDYLFITTPALGKLEKEDVIRELEELTSRLR